MARLAFPGVASALVRQRGPLRLYQWLWLLLCTLGALAAAAPRILSQPVIYTSSTSVALAQARYGELTNQGPDDPDFGAVRTIALDLLRQQRDDSGQPRYAELGLPTLGVRLVAAPGQAEVTAVGGSAEQARALAQDAAEALARSVAAAGGREIFRRLVGWEQYAAASGAPPRTAFQQQLRQIWLTSAFPLNQAIDMEREPLTVDMLQAEDVSDLSRALEVRSSELALIDLPALRLRRDASEGSQRAQLDRDVLRLERGLQELRLTLELLYAPPFRATPNFADPSAPVHLVGTVPLPGAPVDRRIPLLLTLALIGGLAFGALGVAVDRSAGVMAKVLELWSYRALIRNLVLRDLRSRYKGSALGYLWTQLAPLMMMLLFWLVFSSIFQSGVAMFPVFLVVALLPWNYTAEAVTGGASSVIGNAGLIKKVFFPREVLPLVSVFSSLVNYLLSLPMLLLVIASVQLFYAPLRQQGMILNFSWTFAYLPVLLVIQTIFLTGIALFLGALAVFFRDLVHLVGIFVQAWFFLTPVVYAYELINLSPTVVTVIRWLNPMASLVEFYRGILYGTAVPVGGIPTPGLPALDSVLRVLITAVLTLALGYWYFQRQSGRFGEEI